MVKEWFRVLKPGGKLFFVDSAQVLVSRVSILRRMPKITSHAQFKHKIDQNIRVTLNGAHHLPHTLLHASRCRPDGRNFSAIFDHGAA